MQKQKISNLMTSSSVSLLLILFSFFCVIPSAFAWKLPVEISTTADNGEKIYNRLVAGVEQGATGGFDNLWDAPAILTHPDPDKPIILRAYFEGKENNGETRNLWKDVRGTSTNGNTTWDITVDSVPAGRSVVVSWRAQQDSLRKGDRLVLRDNNKVGPDGEPVQVDISGASNYVFVSSGDEGRSLSLVLSGAPAEPSHSGGGSGFGCGTVRPGKSGPADNGTGALSVILLFTPLIFLRLHRLLRQSQG